MILNKKCKGSGKAIGHGCGQIVPISKYNKTNRIYGLGISCGCYPKWLNETEEGREKVKRSTLKAKKDVEKEKRKENKEKRDKLTNWRLKLQTKVQEIARLIDFGHTCIVRKTNGQMHGGHVYGKQSHPEMKFNLHNIHRQSAYSNNYRSDEAKMKEAIIEEYGKEYMSFIDSLRNHQPVKYTNEACKEFYKKACSIANNLKKFKRKRTRKQRISARNAVNKELMLYSNEQSVFKI